MDTMREIDYGGYGAYVNHDEKEETTEKQVPVTSGIFSSCYTCGVSYEPKYMSTKIHQNERGAYAMTLCARCTNRFSKPDLNLR